jgi:hypothetical protein
MNKNIFTEWYNDMMVSGARQWPVRDFTERAFLYGAAWQANQIYDRLVNCRRWLLASWLVVFVLVCVIVALIGAG